MYAVGSDEHEGARADRGLSGRRDSTSSKLIDHAESVVEEGGGGGGQSEQHKLATSHRCVHGAGLTDLVSPRCLRLIQRSVGAPDRSFDPLVGLQLSTPDGNGH